MFMGGTAGGALETVTVPGVWLYVGCRRGQYLIDAEYGRQYSITQREQCSYCVVRLNWSVAIQFVLAFVHQIKPNRSLWNMPDSEYVHECI